MLTRPSNPNPNEGGHDENVEQLLDVTGRDRRRRIRCPKCRWSPTKHDRWACSCGHVWNTFDTAGRCPRCDKQWRDTQCMKCIRWSPHEDWYEQDAPPS
jgi:hypothetical protein